MTLPPTKQCWSGVGGSARLTSLVGKGRWEFETLSESVTRVSFYCEVRSNTWLMHIGFLLGGEKGHNMVYQQLLAALKAHAEA